MRDLFHEFHSAFRREFPAGRTGGAMSDPKLIVYGASCVWWDSIDKCDVRGEHRLPCCPHCKGVLLQVKEAEWWQGVDAQEVKEPGYRAMVEWWRGRCFRTMGALRQVYAARRKG